MADIRRPSEAPLTLWAKHNVAYLAIAYGFSWLLWIGAWIVARQSDTGDPCSTRMLSGALCSNAMCPQTLSST